MKFFYNGLKGSDDKLQKCWYSMTNWTNKPATMIRIYKRDYLPFSREVHDLFNVQNGTDLMTDYFEKDHIDVYEENPLYASVKEALEKIKTHSQKIATRKVA